MEIKEVIGIDISKLTLDCCIHGSGLHEVFVNDLEGMRQLVKWVSRNVRVPKRGILFIFEHTGLYTLQLSDYLCDRGYFINVVPGLEIKRSLGISRGKDDKADARRIALYGYRVREEIKPFRKPGKSLIRLKRLMSMRKKLVVQHSGHRATLKEQKRVMEVEEVLLRAQKEIIAVLGRQIGIIEKEMDDIIGKDPELEELYRLLMSVKGIGHVTARFLIVNTVGFTAFDTWRKFASYCGIAPFPNRSGTSIVGRTKISRLANMEGKLLLHLCACNAIQHSPEMRSYYERRLEKGKSKMGTLNIVRNKLLARAFAVVARRSPYVDTMKFAS